MGNGGRYGARDTT
ncbi:hypothetical protein E2C01_090028 [Portunus trituberculatus]|uniref:Uncharacterized protein n=1 Tax=Portunus trituberculatus TaxID=210409 RepID=A0A5B7JDL8_PORTR|nr:hypothetical protein [Portunus trituberculatus]